VFIFVLGLIVALKRWIPRWMSMSDEEKIAYVTRLLQNLVPIAFNLVTEPEITYGEKTGPIKRSFVLDELYIRIPDEFKQYVTVENLEAILESVLEDARVIWDSNEFMSTVVYGESDDQM